MRSPYWLSLLFILVLQASPSFADEKPFPDTPVVNPITVLNNELVELNKRFKEASGDDKEALQLQLFQKNSQLREKLAAAVRDDKQDKAFIIKQVQIQQSYNKQANGFLDSRIKQLSDNLNNAKDEEKFALLKEYQDAQSHLDEMFKERWQNLLWLQALGKPDAKAVQTTKEDISHRIELLAASVEYLNQQIEADNSQLNVSPESEKATIQLSLIVHQRRLAIATDSLRDMVEVADKAGIETAEYKRQLFQATGDVTQDLLNTKVIISIVSHWTGQLVDWIGENAPQHIFQLFVFFIILLVARSLANIARKVVKRAVSTKNLKFSQLMQDFFISMSAKAVWFIGILIALSQIGLDLTPILTGFGIAGVIIGFALQDTLSNFAAGMMLLIYRPFDVGDFVQAGGVEGKVSHMSLVNTTIRTFDNQIIIVPNSKIWGDVIKNVTHERVRRVDMVFGIGYSDDVEFAEKVLTDIVTSHPAVLRTPEPIIKVHTLNTSSVDFVVRPWVKTDDYWDAYWDITKEVKLRFDREGISIPFPQQDVHLHMVKERE